MSTPSATATSPLASEVNGSLAAGLTAQVLPTAGTDLPRLWSCQSTCHLVNNKT